ncbi:flagellar basal-body rod protein FlgF [Maritalea mediterranea]|uniref:Flagellar basal-body rod protein FlgF n=1 Tax=Maritalea mediterranea TaxID=2909667 RepID=A0ABS9E7F8_9HYPH|nr:flagellar basal-body rod protein FlgF [Maritalea mediterranea]MCF4098813.1 flagellar basal-body rod protein FlgF [Maritalea mediterranea]
MENAQLIGLSRQIALRRQMDVVANNMANLNTVGYKNMDILFEEYVMPVARHKDFEMLDQPLSYTQDWATVHDFSSGSITQTGNPLDVAIQGKGFFVIDTPGGERYTRNGSFQLNERGELVTSEGYNVLADGGFVTFGPEETGITITAEGRVTSSAGDKGILRVAEFDNPQSLRREGDTMFSGENPIYDNPSRFVQMAIERSNVSGVSEMTEMIRVTKAYESISGMQQRQDELRRTAIRKLGDTKA